MVRVLACVDKLSICADDSTACVDVIPARADVSVTCVDATLACADMTPDNIETYGFFYPDIIKKLCVKSMYFDITHSTVYVIQ
ncbi:hypothetical protein [Ureibacillus sp. FSL K6-2830]|uniref:hypothetical protein n=1 Tax=Ureibacillus sp. FSL K6-2830 TaxID=2954610 RepID=UPI0030F7F5A7